MLETADLITMQLQREIVRAPIVMAGQEDYNNALAAPHAVAREESIDAIATEAVLVQQTKVDDPAALEVVSWRADAVMTHENDDRVDFATRARLRVTELAGTIATPQGLLLPDAVKLHNRLPKNLRKQIGKAGVYLHGIEYIDAPVKVEDGPMPITPLGLTQIVHMRPTGRHVLTVDQNKGAPVEFPALPAYATVVEGVYADFYGKKAQSVPTATMIRMNLDDARGRDALQPNGGTDNLALSRELGRNAPDDIRQRMERLATALYAQQPGEPLSAALADALMDPYIVLEANIAIHDKWSYRKPGKGGEIPPSLTHQMLEIRSLAPVFQYEVHEAFMQDRTGPVELLQQSLAALRPTVERAAAFAHHLSAGRVAVTP